MDKDSVYDGMVGKCVKELLETIGKQGHSGMSHSITLSLFTSLAKGHALCELTADLEEWQDVSNMMSGERPMWQNRRCSNVFSEDLSSGKAYMSDGRVYSNDGGETYMVTGKSAVYFDLPAFPPKKEYVDYELSPCPKCTDLAKLDYEKISDEVRNYQCDHLHSWTVDTEGSSNVKVN